MLSSFFPVKLELYNYNFKKNSLLFRDVQLNFILVRRHIKHPTFPLFPLLPLEDFLFKEGKRAINMQYIPSIKSYNILQELEETNYLATFFILDCKINNGNPCVCYSFNEAKQNN